MTSAARRAHTKPAIARGDLLRRTRKPRTARGGSRDKTKHRRRVKYWRRILQYVLYASPCLVAAVAHRNWRKARRISRMRIGHGLAAAGPRVRARSGATS